jgi:hypothetical protein
MLQSGSGSVLNEDGSVNEESLYEEALATDETGTNRWYGTNGFKPTMRLFPYLHKIANVRKSAGLVVSESGRQAINLADKTRGNGRKKSYVFPKREPKPDSAPDSLSSDKVATSYKPSPSAPTGESAGAPAPSTRRYGGNRESQEAVMTAITSIGGEIRGFIASMNQNPEAARQTAVAAKIAEIEGAVQSWSEYDIEKWCLDQGKLRLETARAVAIALRNGEGVCSLADMFLTTAGEGGQTWTSTKIVEELRGTLGLSAVQLSGPDATILYRMLTRFALPK